ncbi:MAG: hypothetical protein LBK82_12700 [Planctomycetaceae bacterium]|nr:hypothetical protein [Planctomycetaceae bacterium]
MSLHFAVVNLIHCQRVRRRDLSAKGRPPLLTGCPPLSIFRIFCQLYDRWCVT